MRHSVFRNRTRSRFADRSWIGFALALLVTLSACGKPGEASDKATRDKAVKAVGASRVTVASPRVEEVSRVLEYTGTVAPIRQVRMVPDVTAKIKKLSVDNGDRVKKGQVLAKLDTKLFNLQRRQAAAALKLAETQLESAESEYERLKPLAESGIVSNQQIDQLESGVSAAEAGTDQAKAAQALATYSIQQSTVKAPFDGIVTNLMVNEGEFVSPQLATYGMLTLVDISQVEVVVNVTEKELRHVSVGLVAEITTEAWPGEVFHGDVAVITPAADPVSKAFPVEIRLANPDEKLKSGMFVSVRLLVEHKDDVLVVPPKAIVDLKDRKVVYVVDDADRAHEREVEVGIESDEGVEITAGELTTQDRVIVEGNFGLKDGASVIVSE